MNKKIVVQLILFINLFLPLLDWRPVKVNPIISQNTLPLNSSSWTSDLQVFSVFYYYMFKRFRKHNVLYISYSHKGAMALCRTLFIVAWEILNIQHFSNKRFLLKKIIMYKKFSNWFIYIMCANSDNHSPKPAV